MHSGSQPFRLVSPEEWVSVIRDEYLGSLIPRGASAVKFVSGKQAFLPALEHCSWMPPPPVA